MSTNHCTSTILPSRPGRNKAPSAATEHTPRAQVADIMASGGADLNRQTQREQRSDPSCRVSTAPGRETDSDGSRQWRPAMDSSPARRSTRGGLGLYSVFRRTVDIVLLVVGLQIVATAALSSETEAKPTVSINFDGPQDWERLEGENFDYIVWVSPWPRHDLTVNLRIDHEGDHLATQELGTRSIIVPGHGRDDQISTKRGKVFVVPTIDNDKDEDDGSITVTVLPSPDYNLSRANKTTLSSKIIDDDPLKMRVRTTLNGHKTDIALNLGRQATHPVSAFFMLEGATLNRHYSLRMKHGKNVVMTDRTHEAPHDGWSIVEITFDAGARMATLEFTALPNADSGTRTVTVLFALFSVKGSGDGRWIIAPSPDGLLVGDPFSVRLVPASDTVKGNDAETSGAPLPMISVADAHAREGAGRPMVFQVTLNRPSDKIVRVRYRTRNGTAKAGEDYVAQSGRVVFPPGETRKKVRVPLLDDLHDEGKERFKLVLSRPRNAILVDQVASGIIRNSDPMPAAWLSRFGRTVAEQALDGIAERMTTPRSQGIQGTLAGRALNFDPFGGDEGQDHAPPSSTTLGGNGSSILTDVVRGFDGNASHFGDDLLGETPRQSRSLTAQEALLGSRFTLTGKPDASGGSLAFWGHMAHTRFDGQEPGADKTMRLNGEVTTGLLGADYARGPWLLGLALTHSTGDGAYTDDPQGDGTIESSLTAAMPYASLRFSEWLQLWGSAGYGAGQVTLKPRRSMSRYQADTRWTMATAGLRGDLLAPPADEDKGGPALALTSDVLWAHTASDKAPSLAASAADVTRLRMGLVGSWRLALPGGSQLTPTIETGARHDGGDAETGFGVELGGGLAWRDPRLGLSLDLSGRTLLVHEDSAFENQGYAVSLAFDPDPATPRGPSFSLRQAFGGQATGGLDALFTPEPLEQRIGSAPTSRWTAEAAWGFSAFGGQFTGSPHLGVALATGMRDYSLGWRLTPEGTASPDISLGLKATRRERDAAQPEHIGGLEVTTIW